MEPFNDRLARIKISLEKINNLMVELKKYSAIKEPEPEPPIRPRDCFRNSNI